MSATVVARNALAADALATAVFVMGPEEGLDLLERLPDTEGVVIDSQGRVRATSGLGAEETAAVPEKEQNRGGPHP
jgi:thiamine biosynthesis lipoprotein